MRFATSAPVAFSLLLWTGLCSAAQAQGPLLRWHDRIDRGAAAARESGKPLFVVFRCVR